MKNANILLVDDDKDQRSSLRSILRADGYRVVEADHHDHAVALLAAEPFDMLLLSITLPGSSGFELLKHLNENQVVCKVIALIGSGERATTGVIVAPGDREHHLPRYNPSALLKSVERVLADDTPATFNLQIVNAGDFIRGTPNGVLDMKASKSGLLQIAAAGAGLHGYTVLIDLREARSQLSTSDVYELARELGTYGDTFQRKTAVLIRADGQVDQARFFETVAQNGGFRVRAFTEFEEAVVWLSKITDKSEEVSS